MDTHLKKTPLPVPTLTLFTKNFSDGTAVKESDGTEAPTFRSLGLQHDLDTEATVQPLKNPFIQPQKPLTPPSKQKQKVRIFIILCNIYALMIISSSLEFVHSRKFRFQFKQQQFYTIYFINYS